MIPSAEYVFTSTMKHILKLGHHGNPIGRKSHEKISARKPDNNEDSDATVPSNAAHNVPRAVRP